MANFFLSASVKPWSQPVFVMFLQEAVLVSHFDVGNCSLLGKICPIKLMLSSYLKLQQLILWGLHTFSGQRAGNLKCPTNICHSLCLKFVCFLWSLISWEHFCMLTILQIWDFFLEKKRRASKFAGGANVVNKRVPFYVAFLKILLMPFI